MAFRVGLDGPGGAVSRGLRAGAAPITPAVAFIVHDVFVQFPLESVTGRKRQLDPKGEPCRSVLASTGQAVRFRSH